MERRRMSLILVGLSIMLIAMSAQATPVSYDFSVEATEGPLIGVTAVGTFTFDGSIIPPGGGNVDQANLFSDLNFTWRGIAYDEDTANTGRLTFDSSGNLLGVIFGTNCWAGGGSIEGGKEQWLVAPFFGGPTGFAYSYPGTSIWDGTFSMERVTPIPEPSTMLLLGSGLIGLAGYGRRKFFKK